MPSPARALGLCANRSVAPVPHAAARRALEPGDAFHERGLAGAVGTDQPDDLALVHVEVDASERLQSAELHVDIAALEDGLALGNLGRRRRPRMEDLPKAGLPEQQHRGRAQCQDDEQRDQ